MIPRARLDLSWSDLFFAAAACFLPGRREALERRIRKALPGGDACLLSLSVRSGFDLLLEALGLPEGSEVLLSAVTVDDMARIVRDRGLVPVPVDIDPDTLAPDPAALEAAWSPRSRVLVAAHLFGAVSELDAAREFAGARGLLFVEDCAQSYIPGRFLGAAESDVRMISFGPIKTDTALGGGVVFVRDGALRERMEALHAARPLQRRRTHLRRVLKYGAIQAMVTTPLFGAFRWGCRLAGRDFDEVLRRLAKGFAGTDALQRIRHQPSTPLLAMLSRRVADGGRRVPARVRAGDELARALEPHVARPGTAVGLHTHWIFPVLPADSRALMLHLRERGFDATSGTSSLTVVAAPAERPGTRAPQAEHVVAHMLFVPAYPEMGRERLASLARVLSAWDRYAPPPTGTRGASAASGLAAPRVAAEAGAEPE